MPDSTITPAQTDALAKWSMKQEEFCKRFVEHMIRSAGFDKFDDRSSVLEYAKEIAPTYWEDQHKRHGDSPEDCADADMSYWGEA